MSVLVLYEELLLSQLTFCPEEDCFTYPCPCGDKFTFYVVVFGAMPFRVGGFEAGRVRGHLSELLAEREAGSEGSGDMKC